MSSVQNTILKSLICVLILISTTQFSFLEKSYLETETSQQESNIISNPSVSPVSTTLRLANNSAMSNVTFSYSASSSGQIIPPDNISLVHDIRAGGSSSYPDAFVMLGNQLLFAANDGIVGEELWKTDGTSNGTVLVKDIRLGNEGSGILKPITIGSTVFFRANDGVHGSELWKTDGTTNGTVLIKDINPDGGSAIDEMLALGNKLLFKADSGTGGSELWVSDGTPSGTYMLKDIRPGNSGSSIDFMTLYKGKAYFRANDGVYGNEIWTSDGTTNGTQLAIEIHPGTSGTTYADIIGAGENLYFVARKNSNRELYVSDGTQNGTMKLTSLQLSSVGDLTAAGDNLFMSANTGTDPNIGEELIFSNGTANGTIIIDIVPGNNSADCGHCGKPKYMTYHAHDGNVYFYGRHVKNGSIGYQFWKSDGTVNGTQLVSTDAKGAWKCNQANPLVSAGRYVYFIMLLPNEGDRNWYRTDGTVNGTTIFGEFSPGQFLRHPGNSDLTVVDGTLYVSSGGDNSGYGYELYSVKNSTGIIAEATWSVYPDLPTGITIDSVTGEVSGTPIVVQNTTEYTVWANTSLESASATMFIEVVGAPEFSYEPSEFNLMRLHAMPTSLPISFGGIVESWEIIPDLPSGLNFDFTTGQISGTPTENQPTTIFTIWGNNSAGDFSFDISISITEEPPNIVYQDPSIELTQYIRMDDLVPDSNGGLIDSWSIDPQLPLGLFFDNGTISGIPGVNQSEQSYTVWANNSEGSDSDIITIEIAPPPLGIVASQSELILVENIAMDVVSLTYVGGNVTTWELEGELPTGLIFDSTNLTISGVTEQIVSDVNVTIWANTTLSPDSITIPITVLIDTDGDAMPDDFGGQATSFLTKDSDDDNDGLSDVFEQSSSPATDSLLADTDGDGVCDGPINVTYDGVEICTSGYDYFPTDPSADADIDGDGLPDEVREGFNTTLVADEDDDGDGLSDVNESLGISKSDPKMPDTDGDGVCDGEVDVTIRGNWICRAGPDAFPNDASAYLDTDSDGYPDDLFGNSTTGLIEDLDDDGDQSSDISENQNGTDPKDPLSFPTDDNDSDGWTNSQEMFCGTDKDDAGSLPQDRDNDMWCDVDDPDDDNDGWTDSIEKDCGTNPLDKGDFPGDDDGDGVCNLLEADNEEVESFPIWIIFVVLAIGLIIAGYVRMGNISKKVEEVISNTQYDATDQIWEDSDDDEQVSEDEME